MQGYLARRLLIMSLEPSPAIDILLFLLWQPTHGTEATGFDIKHNKSINYDPSSVLPLVLDSLLAGKCSLAISGRGARVCLSNPLTHTYPANPISAEP